MTVLVVADEGHLAETVVRGLTERGYVACTVRECASTLARAKDADVEAVIFDLVGCDAPQLIAKLRVDSDAPILVLTTTAATDVAARAIEDGADDYLVKPFMFVDLLARLRAIMRRALPPSGRRIRGGNVDIVTGHPYVHVAGRCVPLSPRERAVLVTLATNLKQAVSRRDLLRALGYDADPKTDIIELHIASLRRKLDGAQLHIERVRGSFYRASVAE